VSAHSRTRSTGAARSPDLRDHDARAARPRRLARRGSRHPRRDGEHRLVLEAGAQHPRGRLELLVVNAAHIKAAPGRKTDVRDAEWIADLLCHGLLRASFVPSRPERELRELTRYRSALIRERASEVNRVQKVLEGANIKLASVASEVAGVSGLAILRALIGGEEDPGVLAALARGRMRAKRAALEETLEGRMGAHQRFTLGVMLRHIGELDRNIEDVSAEIERRLAPHEPAIARLVTIPGIGRRTAETLLAEIGSDMKGHRRRPVAAGW
jgi:transposase